MAQSNARAFAEELHYYMWEFAKEKTPSREAIELFIRNYEDRTGAKIFTEEKNNEKTPALLKAAPESKRLRELAGIPHKGNYV